MARLAAIFMFAGGLLCSIDSMASTITLYDYGINIDGTATCPPGDFCDVDSSSLSVAGVNDSLFTYADGLGQLSLTLSGAGAHNVELFMDHDILPAANTFFNENGAAFGTRATGQSFELDEPGFGNTAGYIGDIFDNFYYSGKYGAGDELDNRAFYDGYTGTTTTTPEDVSMALGWEFSLASGDTANILFSLSTAAPVSGFYLKQFDVNSGDAVYFSSSLSITSVPGPASSLLLALGLAIIGMGRVAALKAVRNDI